jgi:hypothetical protein
MNAHLRVLNSRANVPVVRLVRETVVGRTAECQLKIASAQVSRRHCRILVNQDGVYLEDLGSSNGTFVDGRRLSPHKPHFVSAGSVLEVGPARFVIEYRSLTSAIVSPPVPVDNASPVGGNPRNPRYESIDSASQKGVSAVGSSAATGAEPAESERPSPIAPRMTGQSHGTSDAKHSTDTTSESIGDLAARDGVAGEERSRTGHHDPVNEVDGSGPAETAAVLPEADTSDQIGVLPEVSIQVAVRGQTISKSQSDSKGSGLPGWFGRWTAGSGSTPEISSALGERPAISLDLADDDARPAADVAPSDVVLLELPELSTTSSRRR